MLWEWRLITALPSPTSAAGPQSSTTTWTPSAALNLLIEHQRIGQIHPTMQEEIGLNRDADYANAAINHEHMKLVFLKHQLMISRMRFMLERSCTDSKARLAVMFRQGGDLRGHQVDVPEIRSRRQPGSNEYLWEETDATRRLPVEPDANFHLALPQRSAATREMHFAYEADRGTHAAGRHVAQVSRLLLLHKRHKKHQEAFGIHPIRAVLVEAAN